MQSSTALASLGGRVERAMGIEPTAQAWEAWVLPLYDASMSPILIAEPAIRQRGCCFDPITVLQRQIGNTSPP